MSLVAETVWSNTHEHPLALKIPRLEPVAKSHRPVGTPVLLCKLSFAPGGYARRGAAAEGGGSADRQEQASCTPILPAPTSPGPPGIHPHGLIWSPKCLNPGQCGGKQTNSGFRKCGMFC